MSELAQAMMLTDRAAAKVRKLREGESNPDLKLRVYITGGGCSGFQYDFSFDKSIEKDDLKFENILIKLFNEFKIDIKSKKCCDALIPLYISASNLSKGTPTLFTGNVPVLKAIMASCCLPFIFQPQIINNNVYVDGGFITNILLNLVPSEDRSMALSFSIIHTKEKIKAGKLTKLSPLDYIYKLYKISCLYENAKNPYKNNINLQKYKIF